MQNFKLTWLVFTASLIVFSSCSPKDEDVQTAVNDKLHENSAYAGITASVTGGVVTLSGNCETDGCDAAAANVVKPVKGVKEVKNNVAVTPPTVVTPIEITADDPLKAAVNDALSGYKGVTATVDNGVVTLTGTIKRAELQELMMKLNGLKPKKIDNKLTIE